MERNLYSEERLQAVLDSGEYTDAKHAVSATVDEVWVFQGDADQADDITVLALRYHGVEEVEGESDFHLTISNRVEEIGRVNEAFGEFAKKHELTEAVQRRMNLCFDELLSNVIAYGYTDEDEHHIEVHVRLLREELAVTITDDGRPFNPFGNEPPDTALSVEERPIGGLGVHLVRNFMDRVAYERHGEHNVVLLFKNLGSDNS